MILNYTIELYNIMSSILNSTDITIFYINFNLPVLDWLTCDTTIPFKKTMQLDIHLFNLLHLLNVNLILWI